MRCVFMLVALVLPVVASYAQGIVVDHRSVARFDSIPPQYARAAAGLRMLFMDRSVGGNIHDALNCLSLQWTNAPSSCKRYQHRDSAYAVDPSEVLWSGSWDRSRWRYEFWPNGCSEDVNCFVNFVQPRVDSFDVISFQFSYLAVNTGSKLADTADGFFTTRTDRNTAAAYAAFAARHPTKTVIWWTTSLARGIGTAESQAFNDAMRQYARQHAVVLFDVADILAHDPSGKPCYDNRDGVAYLTEDYPDDGLDIPAICPQYTTETDGGHLGSISAGGIRVAKAFWVLMARIAGWPGGAGPVDTLTLPAKVRLIEPEDNAQLVSDTVRFRWNRSTPNVSRYRMAIALDAAFADIVAVDSAIADTSRSHSSLSKNQRYYWRVQALNSDGWGPWSDVRSLFLQPAQLFSTLPLTEMGSMLYKGREGGLYPSASNQRPVMHGVAGEAIANSIAPLDSNGLTDPVNGRIVMMSIGMSNTSQEYAVFENVLDTFRLKNPRLVSVNGAQGGQTASIIKNPGAQYWQVIEQERLRTKHVTAKQVQVIWLKQANIAPTQAFPTHAEMLRDDIRQILRILPGKYPNVKLCYLSSRIYGGYATTALNPEPYAFESGYSVKWLIEEQYSGDTALSYNTVPMTAPWLSWGPYLWANGPNPRVADGLFYLRDDLIQDGTHPSDAGRYKVARQLLTFFSTDETSVPWFLGRQTGRENAEARPTRFDLAISPNPARDLLRLQVAMPVSGDVEITILDALGRKVASRLETGSSAGVRIVTVSVSGRQFMPGVYFIRAASRNQVVTRSFVLLR
jgi:hypothetical protein